MFAACLLALHEVGGWDGAIYRARWQYMLHIAPRMWPQERFSPEAWGRSAPTERYRLARDLLASGVLAGRSPGEVARLLGGREAESDVIYELRKAPEGNLWWVLHIEFSDGRVSRASTTLAWLDPA